MNPPVNTVSAGLGAMGVGSFARVAGAAFKAQGGFRGLGRMSRAFMMDEAGSLPTGRSNLVDPGSTTTRVGLSEQQGSKFRQGYEAIFNKQKQQLRANQAAGAAWEDDIIKNQLPTTQTDIQPQITIKSKGPSGKRTRMDALGTEKTTGDIAFTEGKASPGAPLTPNQQIVHPELEVYGGVVAGKGKPPYTGGTVIPPTKVNVIRKP